MLWWIEGKLLGSSFCMDLWGQGENMKRCYQAYRHDSCSTGLYPADTVPRLREKGLLSEDAQLLWEIDADTPEEAQAIHNLRMGFGPYNPIGHWLPCPKCGTPFYPYDSSECWRCGSIELEWHPCPKCGMLYPEGGRECLNCGSFEPDDTTHEN